MNLNWNSEFVRFLWIGRQGRYCYNWVFVIGTERLEAFQAANKDQLLGGRVLFPYSPLTHTHTRLLFLTFILFVLKALMWTGGKFWFLKGKWKIKIAGILENSAALYTSGEYGYRPGPCQIRSEEIYVHLLLCSEEFYVEIEVGRWIEDCSLWLSRECEGTFKSQMISSGFISVGIYTCTQ